MSGAGGRSARLGVRGPKTSPVVTWCLDVFGDVVTDGNGAPWAAGWLGFMEQFVTPFVDLVLMNLGHLLHGCAWH